MKKKILQCSTTVFFTMAVLAVNGQNWLITGNSNTTGNGTNFIGTKNAQPLIFKTNNVERMRITKTGQVGIGSLAAPDNILKVTNTSLTTAIFGFTGAGVNSGNGVIGEAESIEGSPIGIRGICGNTAFGFAGFFQGNVHVTGTLSSPSDERLKENIKPAESMLNKVMQLKPSSYNYKKDFLKMNLAQGMQMGFIAQDMEKVFPQLVSTFPYTNVDGNKIADYKGVNYIGMIPILTKALQEQQQTITDVKKENETIKAENAALKLRLDKIEQMLTLNNAQQSSASNAVTVGAGRLDQNAPNPFTQNTVIKYYLPQNAGNAMINVTDINGRVVKTIPVGTTGNGQLIMQGGQLPSGIYQYSLIANGKLLDAKKMILTK